MYFSSIACYEAQMRSSCVPELIPVLDVEVSWLPEQTLVFTKEVAVTPVGTIQGLEVLLPLFGAC